MRRDMGNLKFNYEHENNCNFIVLEEEDNVTEDYQVIMLGRNKVEHFLHFDIRIINGRSHVYYDISSKQQITKLFEYGKLTIEDVKAVCRSLSETVRLANNYMLDIDRLVVQPEYMYMDMCDKSIWFVYLPTETTKTFSEELRKLFDYVLEHFDHSAGKQEVVLLYELYQHILIGDYDPENLMLLFGDKVEEAVKEEIPQREEKEEELSIDSVPKEVVMDEIEEADNQAAIIVKILKIAVSVFMVYGIIAMLAPDYAFIRLTMVQAVILLLVSTAAYCVLVQLGRRSDVLRKIVRIPVEVPYKIKANELKTSGEQEREVKKEFKEELDLEESKDAQAAEQEWNYTVLLTDYVKGGSEEKKLRLTVQGEHGFEDQYAEIKPEQYPYVIGSMHRLSGCVIGKPYISRMHACIQKEEALYYIEDLNSTNGTFVNDKRVIGRREKPLENGDLIRFGMLSYKVEIT